MKTTKILILFALLFALFSIMGIEGCMPAEIKCFDSDSGLDYSIKGYVEGFETQDSIDQWQDYCGISGEEKGKLVEYYCNSDGYGKKFIYDCPNGCQNGACLESPSNEPVKVTLEAGEAKTVILGGINHTMELEGVDTNTTGVIHLDGVRKSVIEYKSYTFPGGVNVYVDDIFYQTKAGILSAISLVLTSD